MTDHDLGVLFVLVAVFAVLATILVEFLKEDDRC